MNNVQASGTPAEVIDVVIIGAGFSGVAVAAKLLAAGIDDVVVLEKAAAIGGVWEANTYPGCACDVPSALYSYAFAPNPDWSRAYSRQPEILEYLQRVAAEHGVTEHVRTGTELVEARWEEDARRWSLITNAGAISAGMLVVATGLFGDPVIPELPGLERFAGPAFHSAAWNHDLALVGQRVAVVGTGASAAQFIPAIQPEVEQLVVFQRTPPWIMPRLDYATGPLQRALFRRVPLAQRALRSAIYALVESLGLPAFVDQRFGWAYESIGRAKLRRQVADPVLRSVATPQYRFGCKRPILSDEYLPALGRPNVTVTPDAITEVREHSIVTADGTEHEVDVIIFGTGFETPTRAPDRIFGADGSSIMARYDERPQSYLGTSMAGFPNCFLTLGPYGASGNQSAIYIIERQADYIRDAITATRRAGHKRVEVRAAIQEAYVDEAERRSVGTVWVNGGCRSYYQTPDGNNAGLWPGWSFAYARRAVFDPSDFASDAAEPTGALQELR